MNNFVRKSLLALAVSSAVAVPTTASAVEILNGWNLNLSLLNGQSLSNGDVIAGASNATNIDYATVSGESTVTQQVVNGSALGQTFSDSGYLQYLTYQKEAGAGTLFDYGINANPLSSSFTNTLSGFVEFSNLTGTLNNDGSITFNPGSGTINFWVEDDGDANSTTGNVLKLFSLALVAPSGGSDLDFYGGGGANGTIDLTAVVTWSLFGGLFTDNGGKDITTIALQLVNTDSLLDDDFKPNNPDNRNVNPLTGNGYSLIHVENAGQHKVAEIPEPGSLALASLGLLGLGFMNRRRKNA